MARLALPDRVVLVTGGASGIGLATAARDPRTRRLMQATRERDLAPERETT
jgi:NADP-dependent 3-hydroxy acid dehydrogenase YdfG